MKDKTMQALADALKDQLETKPLDKITVTDLTKQAGIYRQTFYYSFHDIYDLVEWIYVNESYKTVDEKIKTETWQQELLLLFRMLKNNKNFVLKTFNSPANERITKLLIRYSKDILSRLIHEILDDYNIPQDDLDYITNFYAYAIFGFLLEWVDVHNMKEEPEEVVQRLEGLLEGSFRMVIDNFSID